MNRKKCALIAGKIRRKREEKKKSIQGLLHIGSVYPKRSRNLHQRLVWGIYSSRFPPPLNAPKPLYRSDEHFILLQIIRAAEVVLSPTTCHSAHANTIAFHTDRGLCNLWTQSTCLHRLLCPLAFLPSDSQTLWGRTPCHCPPVFYTAPSTTLPRKMVPKHQEPSKQ